jgi:hypothetical protein
MFSWLLSPSAPCDPSAKAWIEARLRWLSEQFGLHILLERSIILPTEEYFPEPWEPTPEGARTLFRRVREYMHVDEDAIDLEFFNDQTPSSMRQLDPSLGIAAGTWSGGDQPWERGTIRLEYSILDNPSSLIGTMAHELSHERLLGEGRLHSDAFDNELLTDLTALFFGFGVFIANNAHKSTGELSNWPGTELHRPEYLSEPMIGYALAHIAWFRDESHPEWAKRLGWVPRSVFKSGFRYLERTGDSNFQPVRFR